MPYRAIFTLASIKEILRVRKKWTARVYVKALRQ